MHRIQRFPVVIVRMRGRRSSRAIGTATVGSRGRRGLGLEVARPLIYASLREYRFLVRSLMLVDSGEGRQRRHRTSTLDLASIHPGSGIRRPPVSIRSVSGSSCPQLCLGSPITRPASEMMGYREPGEDNRQCKLWPPIPYTSKNTRRLAVLKTITRI